MTLKSKSTYSEVAALHARSIDRGFLPSLGEGFLALLYEAIDSSEDAILIVEHSEGRVYGFVAGASSLGDIYKSLLRRPIRLILTLCPVILSPKKVWRIIELLIHTLWSAQKCSELGESALPSFELISISVSRNMRRSGVAHRLYDRLKEAAKSRGFDSFKIIVGEELVGAHKFYTRMGALPVCETSVHGGKVSLVYIQDC